MKWFLASLLALSFTLHAGDEALSLKNTREGKTFYSKLSDRKAQQKAAKVISAEKAAGLFREALKKQDPKKSCAYTLIDDVSSQIASQKIKVEVKGFLLQVREAGELDDVSLKILLRSHEVNTAFLHSKAEEDLIMPEEGEETDSIVKLIASFDNRFMKDACFDEAYRSFFEEVRKVKKKVKAHHLEALLWLARKENKISQELYLKLERARVSELDKTSLTLANYVQKRNSLRLQYPLRDETERSNFVALKVNRLKMSHRQKLYENYSDMQIMIMASVIKTLRQDLEGDMIKMGVYRNGVLTREVTASGTAVLGFALTSLRREMGLLALNTYFNGRAPDYMDLLTASYEIGIIPASELDDIAALEELWNPKRKFWDKAGVWIKTFSSVATIVIPPPYGFIPALAIVVIEATTGSSSKNKQDDPTMWFKP